jgi:septation ring formation regulator EzrA
MSLDTIISDLQRRIATIDGQMATIGLRDQENTKRFEGYNKLLKDVSAIKQSIEQLEDFHVSNCEVNKVNAAALKNDASAIDALRMDLKAQAEEVKAKYCSKESALAGFGKAQDDVAALRAKYDDVVKTIANFVKTTGLQFHCVAEDKADINKELAGLHSTDKLFDASMSDLIEEYNKMFSRLERIEGKMSSFPGDVELRCENLSNEMNLFNSSLTSYVDISVKKCGDRHESALSELAAHVQEAGLIDMKSEVKDLRADMTMALQKISIANRAMEMLEKRYDRLDTALKAQRL